jgi:integrative and conjugative element protein (TIGR02256 family)
MKLLLPQQIIDRLKRQLRWRVREIGGVLVGEHVDADVFRIVDISVQSRGGTVAHFVRDPEQHKVFLADFFARTGYDYERFNYIGEWHSHPTFQPLPSGSDISTMFDLVEDPDVGINFAILIIARLHFWQTLEMSATLFRAVGPAEAIEVKLEEEIQSAPTQFQSALCRLLTLVRW